jgi:hypothetical protein
MTIYLVIVVLNISIDIIDAIFQEIFIMKDEGPETDYEVDVKSDLNYINDEELVGKTFLAKSDETFNDSWIIYI